MLIPRRQDTIHKAWLMRLLTLIADNQLLASSLAFKGGTCAAMRGFIDRFSIDLDFDLLAKTSELKKIRREFEKIFDELGFTIKDQSSKTAQYFLRYPVVEDGRNTIKLDVVYPHPKANIYEKVRLPDIDRYLSCSTIETMFANKLVSVLDRYEKHKSIAARDLYDIHNFFLKGFKYSQKVIEERRGKDIAKFLTELIKFIEKNISDKIINQDLNPLLRDKEFQKIRKILKSEVLMFLREELQRV